MSPMLLSLAVLVAVLCAGLMGYAIQRGATCTVAAVDELLTQRRANRLLAMGEASLWVAGGLALAQTLHLLPSMPAAYSVSGWVFAGAALLGVGAWINGACVFGAIARLGSGDVNYVATPIGYYLGCLSVAPLFAAPAATRLAAESPVLRASGVLAQLARGMSSRLAIGVVFLLALYVGALVGGWTAGRLRVTRPTVAGLAEYLVWQRAKSVAATENIL